MSLSSYEVLSITLHGSLIKNREILQKRYTYKIMKVHLLKHKGDISTWKFDGIWIKKKIIE